MTGDQKKFAYVKHKVLDPQRRSKVPAFSIDGDPIVSKSINTRLLGIQWWVSSQPSQKSWLEEIKQNKQPQPPGAYGYRRGIGCPSQGKGKV